MVGINRFLSRKDRKSPRARANQNEPGKRYSGLFQNSRGSIDDESTNSATFESSQDGKVRRIQQMLAERKMHNFKNSDIAFALTTEYTGGDADKTLDLLCLLDESERGRVRPYSPQTKLLGAVNREGVTCYLDALLFSMFACLDNFEVMLHKSFTDAADEHRQRLAMLIRLWVNMIRAGKLVTVEITQQIQMALSLCGWKEAVEPSQQDASEAFSFITETLALPLLTLKMNIFHTGKEDHKDDHKLVKERLLELAIPDASATDHATITLEDCLEVYFNNKIEVKRYLDMLERSNTFPTTDAVSRQRAWSMSKGDASHVELAHHDPDPTSNTPQRNNVGIVHHLQAADSSTPPRSRATSIIQEKILDEKHGHHFGAHGHPRIRKEVMMPAWQFFSLIPWYTDEQPTSDAQVAAHLQNCRPMLGICLKRYTVSPSGSAVKKSTHIDIPLEIALPHFISDDDMSENAPAFGNFKMSLQSVVCHQGPSVDVGHYISLARSTDVNSPGQDRWLRFDDMAPERVVEVDINQQLKQESPYLLFYQLRPIEGGSGTTDVENGTIDHISSEEDPPAYRASMEPIYMASDPQTDHHSSIRSIGIDQTAQSQSLLTSDQSRLGPVLSNVQPHSIQAGEDKAHPTTLSQAGNPQTMASSIVQSTGDTPPEMRDRRTDINDSPNTIPSAVGLRGSNNTGNARPDSRPVSQVNENRLSQSLSRLASRMSKDRLSRTSPSMCQSPKLNPAESFSDQSTEARPSFEEPHVTTLEVVGAAPKASDRARIRKEAKIRKEEERQHAKLTKREAPERDCIVM